MEKAYLGDEPLLVLELLAVYWVFLLIQGISVRKPYPPRFEDYIFPPPAICENLLLM